MKKTHTGDKRTVHWNEEKHYVEARYMSPIEAEWRILQKEMQDNSHAVYALPVHLNNQTVQDGDDVPAVTRYDNRNSPLVAAMKYKEANRGNSLIDNCLYKDLPTIAVWQTTKHPKNEWEQYSWTERKQHANTIGRLYTVSPAEAERYHLRLLLDRRTDFYSYEQLLTYNGVIYNTYQEVCLAMGIIDDDKECIDAMQEAINYKYGTAIRKLFATIMVHTPPTKPRALWDKFKEGISEDILYHYKNITKEQAENRALCIINSTLYVIDGERFKKL